MRRIEELECLPQSKKCVGRGKGQVNMKTCGEEQGAKPHKRENLCAAFSPRAPKHSKVHA